jgi:hypothetical protein
MKLIEAAGKAHSVILEKNKKVIFIDDRETCIRFIKGFDKGSPEYVDLRLVDPSGKEDDWHKD